MAGPEGVRDPPGTEETPQGFLPPTRDSRAPRILRGDRVLTGAASYFILFSLLFVGAGAPLPSDWMSGTTLHGNFETLSILLAFVVGALALVRFYSKRRGTYLFIGTGFLGTAFLDTIHGVLTSGVGGDWTAVEILDLSSWTFTASGFYLSLFLFVSVLAWRRENRGPAGEEMREVPVYLTAAFLAVLIFGVFFTVFDLIPVTQAVYPGAFLSQPAELFPALFFLLALGGYLGKGHWRFDPFEHWLVISLLLGMMAHGAYMPFSNAPHDADFDAAHLLKVLSYGAVLIGLMASVYVTFRREEEAAEANREANLALAREIEVRRRAERVLQESEERLQDFLDNAFDLIQSVDPEGRLLYVNQAWLRVLGYSSEETRDLSFFDLLHPSCKNRCIRDFQAVLEGRSSPSFEVEFVARDGRVVRCLGSANSRFQDGAPVAIRSIFRDVSGEVDARKKLEAFQANLRALVENTGDAIWSVDRSLRLITFNTAFSMALEARTGREPRTGDPPEVTFPAADAPWYREMFARALKGEAFSELRDEEIGGQIRSYEHFFNPIREADGITGAAVFGKDVTARRRTQLALRMAKEEAERANKAKSQFLANMSHELRTPLNSVIGFTNIVSKNRGGRLTPQELGYLERISANGKHLLDLINEVLDLAKIEAGRMELDLRNVALGPLIQETLGQIEGQVREKHLVLRGVVPSGTLEVRTDPGKLKQVLINLLGNALKFTEKGEVVVEVVLRPDGATPGSIRVRDTGIGIPPDRLSAIFEAFQQADGTTSRKYGGTGLGLTISRSLCQLLGYDLKVESEVGRGSVFSILLADDFKPVRSPGEELMEEALRPLESTKPRRHTPGRSKPESPTVSSRRVLVIDDDSDSRVLLTHFLEELGCSVVEACSGAEGLQKARKERPALISMDLMMPGMTGWEALRALKEDPELRDIPVIIVSILAGEGDRSSLLGAVDLLPKPVDRAELMRVVARNLDPTRGRMILVVDDDPDTRTVLRNHLEEAGLVVRTAANGREAEASLAEGTPDAILLDLLMPVMDGMTFLKRLRDDPGRMGIPVIICTGKELSLDELTRIQTEAAGIVRKGEGFEEELREILGKLFPLKGGG